MILMFGPGTTQHTGTGDGWVNENPIHFRFLSPSPQIACLAFSGSISHTKKETDERDPTS
jgi:hypothetical protein